MFGTSKNILKNLFRALLCFLLLVTLAFLVRRYWYMITVPIAAQEDDIREAVLRDAFNGPIIHCGGNDTCCVSLEGGGDPSDVFLARLNGRYRKGSECKKGRWASAVTVGRIKWNSRTEAELTVSLYCGNMCGFKGTYSVYRDNGNWIVMPLQQLIF
jgi:hypothetical protein